MQAIRDRISHYIQRVKSIVYREKVVMFVWVVGENMGIFRRGYLL